MNCYKCPHKADVDAFAEWDRGDKSTPCPIDEKRREKLIKACSSCCTEPSHHGESFVQEDALTFCKINADYLRSLRPSDPVTDLPPGVEGFLKSLLCKIADLELLDAPIALGLLKGMTLVEIGRELDFSRARVFARLARMAKRAPWILAIHKSKIFGSKIAYCGKSLEDALSEEIANGTDDFSSDERLPASFRPVAFVSVYTGAIVRTFPTLADFARDRAYSHAKVRSFIQKRTKLLGDSCRLVFADVPLPADLARLRETGTDGQEPRPDAPGQAPATDTPTEGNE